MDRSQADDLNLNPLINWSLLPLEDIAIAIRLVYVASRDEAERGDSKTLQLLVTPAQALEFAELLMRMAESAIAGTGYRPN